MVLSILGSGHTRFDVIVDSSEFNRAVLMPAGRRPSYREVASFYRANDSLCMGNQIEQSVISSWADLAWLHLA